MKPGKFKFDSVEVFHEYVFNYNDTQRINLMVREISASVYRVTNLSSHKIISQFNQSPSLATLKELAKNEIFNVKP